MVEDDKVPGDDDATPATRRRSSGMVAEMVTLSGSRREALRREPSCLMRMCDARTVSPSPAAADDMLMP